MADAATPEAVMAAYADLINRHDFVLLVPLIADNAVFWFSSGSYVGLEQVRSAFERTWQHLQNETYWLESLTWIAKGDEVASALTTSIGAPRLMVVPPKAPAAAPPYWQKQQQAGASSTSISARFRLRRP